MTRTKASPATKKGAANQGKYPQAPAGGTNLSRRTPTRDVLPKPLPQQKRRRQKRDDLRATDADGDNAMPDAIFAIAIGHLLADDESHPMYSNHVDVLLGRCGTGPDGMDNIKALLVPLSEKAEKMGLTNKVDGVMDVLMDTWVIEGMLSLVQEVEDAGTFARVIAAVIKVKIPQLGRTTDPDSLLQMIQKAISKRKGKQPIDAHVKTTEKMHDMAAKAGFSAVHSNPAFGAPTFGVSSFGAAKSGYGSTAAYTAPNGHIDQAEKGTAGKIKSEPVAPSSSKQLQAAQSLAAFAAANPQPYAPPVNAGSSHVTQNVQIPQMPKSHGAVSVNLPHITCADNVESACAKAFRIYGYLGVKRHGSGWLVFLSSKEAAAHAASGPLKIGSNHYTPQLYP